MTARVRVIVVLTCMVAGLMTSCESPPKQTVYPPVAAHRVPPELLTIDARAQQLMLAVADNNWPQIHACVKDINDAWLTYKYPTVTSVAYRRPPTVLLRGPLDGSVLRLKFAHGKGQAQGIMVAANEIDAATILLLEYYLPEAPLDLRRLRMLEGRILVNATQNRLAPALAAFEEMRRVWERVRPAVAAEFSEEAVGAFEECLSAQQAALNSRDYEAFAAWARQGMDRVNERVRPLSEEKK